MKGEICPQIGRVNGRMEKLGLKLHSPEYLCQRGSCGGCYLNKVAKGEIPDYDLI